MFPNFIKLVVHPTEISSQSASKRKRKESTSQRAFQKHVPVIFSNKDMPKFIAPCKVAAQLL
jgi:hypothetical protein